MLRGKRFGEPPGTGVMSGTGKWVSRCPATRFSEQVLESKHAAREPTSLQELFRKVREFDLEGAPEAPSPSLLHIDSLFTENSEDCESSPKCNHHDFHDNRSPYFSTNPSVCCKE